MCFQYYYIKRVTIHLLPRTPLVPYVGVEVITVSTRALTTSNVMTPVRPLVAEWTSTVGDGRGSSSTLKGVWTPSQHRFACLIHVNKKERIHSADHFFGRKDGV